MNSHSIVPPKEIFNKKLYAFLYSYFKSIFIIDLDNRKKKNEKIEEYIKKIKEIYKIELKREYSKENFENIIKFVKTQNIIYGGEILENILLKLFCSVMNVPPYETTNKYIYYNFQNIIGLKNNEKPNEKQLKEIKSIQNFINYDKIYPSELKNNEIFFQTNKNIQTDFEYFLTLIYQLKIDSIKINNRSNKKKFNDITHTLYNYSIKNSDKEENNISNNSIIQFEKNINLMRMNIKNKIIPVKVKNENNNKKKTNESISIISYFFFTLFTNYQTINSRLMKYTENDQKNNEFAVVPYEYNINGGLMKGEYAILISSPMRQDDRITKISMTENDMRELGMLELGKTIVFNKKVKTINYSKNRLYSYFFDYFINGAKLFENNNVEEINFYNNFIKDDVEDYLCDILNKFGNLKSINLSTNKLCSGISKFLSHLKLLYRQKRTKIEKLNLNNCSLDKSSIYELSELLKSKDCILKCLYLNLNNINNDLVEPLLKSIKKNKYLKELYLGRNYIGNNSTNNICKIISKPINSLESLYLYLNEIKNQDNLLRIIARTKVVYAKEEDKQNIIIDFDENSILKNLDLSKNNINMKNRKQIMLFSNLINDTNLSCLDYSLILDTPESQEKHKRNNSQVLKDEFQLLVNDINEIKNQRNDIFNFIDEVNINKNRYNNIFEKYIEKEEINDLLVQTIGDKNLFTVCEEEVENLISYELLDILGSTEKDLNDDNNYNIITNIIKYNILYKVNGGLIHKWFKGINKCLIIV